MILVPVIPAVQVIPLLVPVLRNQKLGRTAWGGGEAGLRLKVDVHYA